MKLIYSGQSSFLVDVQGKKILFEAFITDKEKEKIEFAKAGKMYYSHQLRKPLICK